jgi:hypothetical protein
MGVKTGEEANPEKHAAAQKIVDDFHDHHIKQWSGGADAARKKFMAHGIDKIRAHKKWAQKHGDAKMQRALESAEHAYIGFQLEDSRKRGTPPTPHRMMRPRGLMRSETERTMYRQDGDTLLLSKGIWAYDDREGKAATVPDQYLYEYICGFIAEAVKHECCEAKRKALTAGEDIYDQLATEIMMLLVSRMPRDKNLTRAAKKFKVTHESIATVLKQRNLVPTPSDSRPSGRDYFPTDTESAVAMGAVPDGSPTSEVMMASADPNSWAKGTPGVTLAKSEESQFKGPVAPPPVFNKAQAAVRSNFDKTPPRLVKSDCPIHGAIDPHGDNYQHAFAECTCN